MDVDTQPLLQVIGYHQETKHHFFRYARALGYLDWANQPDPFRRFAGAPVLDLPIVHDDGPSPSYDALYRPGIVPPQRLTVTALSRFLHHALAITAWKEAGGTRWALRSNPSSGNLHPTEGYVLLPAVDGLAPEPGLYHYAPQAHALERRTSCPQAVFDTLMRAFPPGAFLCAFSSIHWREAWKYGERAFRYCQHDVGHAIGTMRIGAAALGWTALLLEEVTDDRLAALMGLDRESDFDGAEREHPDCVAVVYPVGGRTEPLPLFLEDAPLRELTAGGWQGRANRLSAETPVPWELIDVVAGATWKTVGDRRLLPDGTTHRAASVATVEPTDGAIPAGHIIRQRRSALAFDGRTSMPAARLFLMLERILPQAARPVLDRPMPWDTVPWRPGIHLGLFVHRVDGLESGLYALVRDPAALDGLRAAMHQHFLWVRPPGCPDGLPLFQLQVGDARRLAAQVSCHQDIAGEGCFSLGMLAEFEGRLAESGPWFYRRLFWEAGLIGQVLYLEAEAAGLRATGIGCYFDDPVHQVFGLSDQAYQSLYHFTTGGPVDDPRLTTLPAYTLP